MVAPIYNWGGLYIGLNGGGGSSRKCWDINTALGVAVASTAEACHDATGGLAGGQIGYRLQAGTWVFGAEAQGDWADLKGSNSTLLLPAAFRFIANNNTNIDAIGLFTGQIGYAWNNVLWYLKGGAATTHDKYEGPASHSTPRTKVVGAPPWAPESNLASRPVGRLCSNTTTCLWEAATTRSPSPRPLPRRLRASAVSTTFAKTSISAPCA